MLKLMKYEFKKQMFSKIIIAGNIRGTEHCISELRA